MGCCGSVSGASTHPEAPKSTALSSAKSVAVIGGGLAGLSSAYFLAKKGVKVEVFERNSGLAAECSYGPAGVTMWKAVQRGLKLAVDPTAGGVMGGLVYLEGMAWQMLDPDPRRPTLMLEARKVHSQFVKDEPGAADILHDTGLMYVLDEEYFNKNREQFKDDQSMIFYTKPEFEKSDLYAPLFDGCTYHGVLVSKEEGAIDPHRLVKYMSTRVEAMGGKVNLNSDVQKLSESGGQVQVHVGGQAAKSFDGCVLAVGATTHPSKLLKSSGYSDDVSEIYGVKGYTVTGRMPAGALKMGFVDATDTKFIRPFTDLQGNFCIRAGSIADPFDESNPLEIKWDRLDEFKGNQFVKKVFAANKPLGADGQRADTAHDCIIEEGKIEVWTGIRPVNKHGRVPLFRWVNGSERVLVVSGFGSNGFVMCWHCGPRVAQLFGKATE